MTAAPLEPEPEDAGTTAPRSATHRDEPRPGALRFTLVTLDAVGVAIAWMGALLVGAPTAARAVGVVAAVAVTLLVMRSQLLYRARVCSVRSVELVRIATSAAIASGIMYAGSRAVGRPLPGVDTIVAAALVFLIVGMLRGWFAAWLRGRRHSGAYCRPVLLVGWGEEAADLAALVGDHPELGFRIMGSVGDGPLTGVAWLGPLEDACGALDRTGTDGVLIAASDLGARDLNRTVRDLARAGAHIQFSSGLHGIDHRRIRSVPLAHEPLYYLEPASLSRGQLAVKRALDVVGAGILLVLTSPFVALGAIAIKVGDGGPVFFRQVRIGHRGRPFTLFKLRTMVPDAETQLVDVRLQNERNGPLFKLRHDPRRTRVGRILERTSLDEVPQLVNVLRGEMSLVGPRPALPHEVEQFEPELLGRHDVVPGITGLWQVEGRENPSFDVYRRLDLFYVENWSIALDLVILAATFHAIVARFTPFGHRRDSEPALAGAMDPPAPAPGDAAGAPDISVAG